MNVTEHSGDSRVVELLEKVKDRESFLAFVAALIAEREEAENLEREQPEFYRWGGAMGWQNSEISSYLEAALACVEDSGLDQRLDKEPSWQAFAEFLYMGKIYE